MGLLDSSTLTVNAMLTTRGRELLSNEGSINHIIFKCSKLEIHRIILSSKPSYIISIFL